MRQFIYLVISVLALVGCASAPYGNFTHAPATYYQKMAADTIQQLMALYPPAMTHFELQQSVNDPYGKVLVTSLRAHGYAISEFKRNRLSKNRRQGSIQHSEYSTKLPFAYVVDKQEDTHLYHLYVVIGDELLTRVYFTQNQQLLGAGSWVYKER